MCCAQRWGDADEVEAELLGSDAIDIPESVGRRGATVARTDEWGAPATALALAEAEADPTL